MRLDKENDRSMQKCFINSLTASLSIDVKFILTLMNSDPPLAARTLNVETPIHLDTFRIFIYLEHQSVLRTYSIKHNVKVGENESSLVQS